GGLSLITDAPVLQTLTFTNQNRQEDAPKLKGVKGAVFWGVLRGLLIALPVVAFFAILLTSADAVFALRFEDFLNFLKIEDIAEYILRGFIILLVSYLLAGVYIHAFYKNHDESLDDERKPWFPAMLGIVESAIVLGSTNLLFISFVVIQFQYFFGGSANIYLDGYTYSEYARRGFGELIAVAVFSLLLFVTLSQITKRETGRQKGVFSALGIVLVSLVLVILVSSFQRLQLYELAYGFSRLRAYSHVFIIWLGILLLAVILLEIRQRQKFLVLVVSMAAIGFVVSLNLLNVDSFIAKQNIARIAKGKGLDIGYLSRLSPDVLPTLWQSYQEKPSSMVAGAIACYAEWYDMDPEEELPWQSFHFSRRNAAAAWAEIEDFPAAKVFQAKFDGKKENWWNAYVVINSRHQHCSNGNRD
ncbi:MAG: DUF4173 domain-containing protein, partial [Anaerolineae bacterium]|nr:DUF4173 domain-containing protein [Anaerolineae bacterium]